MFNCIPVPDFFMTFDAEKHSNGLIIETSAGGHDISGGMEAMLTVGELTYNTDILNNKFLK